MVLPARNTSAESSNVTRSVQPRSFFARHRGLILLSMLFSFPLVGWQAWESAQNIDNSVRQWLPSGNRETAEFDWFMERFGGDEIVFVSWEGCTIDDPRLEQLALAFEEKSSNDAAPFARIQTSRRLIQQLTSDRFGLSRREAIKRLTHSFVGQDGKTGCAVLTLSDAGKLDRKNTMNTLFHVAEADCGIPVGRMRVAGPVVDNVALDIESQETIRKYLPLCIGLVLLTGIWSLRSVRISLYIFAIAIYNACFSLALLRWCGGQLNLVLIMLPTLVYVLSISSAVHLVNYYYEARRNPGRSTPVSAAVSDGWKPCLFAALTTAFGLASLGISQITPVREFGIYCAISLGVSFLTTFLFLPALLESNSQRSGQQPKRRSKTRRSVHHQIETAANPLIQTVSRWVTRRYKLVTLVGIALMVTLGIGVIKTTSSVRILGNFSDQHQILQDYAWLEENIGPMIPVEVVIAFDDSVEANNLQRVELVRRVSETLDELDEVAGTVSAATFVPAVPQGSSIGDVVRRAAMGTRLDLATSEFVTAGLLSETHHDQAWRISARIKALEDIDYGHFIDRLRRKTEPLLVDKKGRRLEGASVTITGIIPLVYRAQRQLLNDLAMSFVTAFVIISVVTAIIVHSWTGGCVAMIPNLFPVLIVFGLMGLLGLPVRISAVLTASAALGIAVDDTLHFFTWVRRAVDAGADRKQAVRSAFTRCAPAMFQTTLINGIGLLVFAFTLFLPTRLFAILMIALLTAALAGDLVLLPALLVGPLGKFVRPKLIRPRRREHTVVPNSAHANNPETLPERSSAVDTVHSKYVSVSLKEAETASGSRS
jgi:predicted RND superfamily exporter protein